jgi:hypothetical protein
MEINASCKGQKEAKTMDLVLAQAASWRHVKESREMTDKGVKYEGIKQSFLDLEIPSRILIILPVAQLIFAVLRRY